MLKGRERERDNSWWNFASSKCTTIADGVYRGKRTLREQSSALKCKHMQLTLDTQAKGCTSETLSFSFSLSV